MEKEITIKRDGLNLYGRLFTPNQDEYDLVILMHGFTADLGYQPGKLLYNLAPALQKAGLATLRFDFNGHGQSDGELKDMTILNEIQDANAIIDFVRQLKGVRQLYLLGHSQGGVIASLMAGYYADIVKKVVLMAPAASLVEDARMGICQGSMYDPAHVPSTITVNDKTIGGFYFRIAQTLPIYELAKNYQGPVCLIHGTNDTIVDPSASLRYHETYQNSQLKLINGCDHSFTDPEKQLSAINFTVKFLTE